ncbi:MAG: hypothetical protein L6R36_005270 [Xanthoria steineri]|nr:MAG: hypothetical protein L6R36_005270 [Xanthoria steineri]
MEPVTLIFPDMKARKLSMGQSTIEVYDLDPKIDVRLSLWVGVPVHVDILSFAAYNYSKSVELMFGLDQEIMRPRGMGDLDTDLWPFVLYGREHTVFRIHPPSSDTQGVIRYYVTWKTFGIILRQLTHRLTFGNEYTPWEDQYVDVRAVEAPHGRDKVSQAEKWHHTHVRMPTGEENMVDPFRFFGKPSLGSSHVEKAPAARCESGQTVAQVPQDAKTMHEATESKQAVLDSMG